MGTVVDARYGIQNLEECYVVVEVSLFIQVLIPTTTHDDWVCPRL